MANITSASAPAQEFSISTAAATMVNGATIFTVNNGPIIIVDLLSVCVTVDDTTASTLQYQSAPTVGSAATISGATTSLGSAAVPAAGAIVRITPTALSTAPTIVLASAGGVSLGLNAANRILVQAGTIKLVIGVGSTTGTWRHYLRYIPLDSATYVS